MIKRIHPLKRARYTTIGLFAFSLGMYTMSMYKTTADDFDNKNENVIDFNAAFFLMKSTVDPREIARFAKMANQWWDPKGQYSILHQMNPCRVGYITNLFNVKNKKILDLGCGGGFLSEALAKQGAIVMGVDATAENINVAKAHLDPSLSVDYLCASAEDLVDKHQFDAVCALEIIEHVPNPDNFVRLCAKLTKVPKLTQPDGFLFFSTINRTFKSRFLSIFMAEHVLGIVPKGTHTWSKYVTPAELQEYVTLSGATTLDTCGMVYNPICKTWHLDGHDLGMNYITSCRKNPQEV